ncbi:isopropylmalate isomerase [Pseudorhodobacter turbinis]|uniref:Isopropylmalate isomerase n=1 Tax=Pseudorhodobacter turbinis TaxID=2500533 RepID=A0A4P8EEB0_9RHOB|nr:isopropylmalate isomerase [Pseudorhodobacter turbinis]QCO55381.1 isopropylmalate isomerase [Pseudorhodobacter turbinis]
MALNIPWTCVFTTWSPTIGDPTVMGWVTVASYLLAGILSVLVFFRKTGRQRIFWLILAVILFALTVNKQLDLQSALTAIGRCVAKAQGWYAERRPFQIKFIIFIVLTSFLIAAFLIWTMRRELAHIWLALLGLVFLLAFVAIRAAGFHHIDRLIGYQINNIRMNWVMELGGIAMIAANGLYLLLRTPKNKKSVAPQ